MSCQLTSPIRAFVCFFVLLHASLLLLYYNTKATIIR